MAIQFLFMKIHSLILSIGHFAQVLCLPEELVKHVLEFRVLGIECV